MAMMRHSAFSAVLSACLLLVQLASPSADAAAAAGQKEGHGHAIPHVPFKRALAQLRQAVRQRRRGRGAMSSEKVVGGFPVGHIEDYPFYVLLDAQGGMCGGSLIAPNLVLTAAHCTGATQYDAYIGTLELYGSNAAIIPAVGVAVHPHYNAGTLENDIAILILEHDYTSDISFAVPSSDVPSPGTSFSIMGFGTTSYEGSVSDTFLEASVVGMDHATCASTIQGVFEDSMLCASEFGTTQTSQVDTCQGDSGGPMVLATDVYQQVGIVSWGIGCAGQTPGVYTRVSSYVGSGKFLQPFLDGQFNASDYPLPTSPTGSADSHTCADGQSIAAEYFCDGSQIMTGHPWPEDCADGSDEGAAVCCPFISSGNASEFQTCVYAEICNYEPPEGLCGEYCDNGAYVGDSVDICDSHMTCDSGQLLPPEYLCDGSTDLTGHYWPDDCADGSDEGIHVCCPLLDSGTASEWQTCVYADLCGFTPPSGMCGPYCDNGAYMGVLEYLCDDYVDCTDGSDETNCDNPTNNPDGSLSCTSSGPRLSVAVLHAAGVDPRSVINDVASDLCMDAPTT